MSQIKIYGIEQKLKPIRNKLSDTIHQCVVKCLKYPKNKRAHRFIYLDEDDFFMPDGRSPQYTIIELMMISGRKKETKKNLIQTLFSQIEKELSISPVDIEICIVESPAENWGFRGKTGDEVDINYKIDVWFIYKIWLLLLNQMN